jgi:hypothetical protein
VDLQQYERQRAYGDPGTSSMDAFPNTILWPLYPATGKMTDYRLFYGYMGLALGFGVTAMLIIIFTRGRLGYQHYRPESQA